MEEDQLCGGRSEGHEHKPRGRDIFPLPFIDDQLLSACESMVDNSSRPSFVTWCKLVVLGLNRLAGCTVPCRSARVSAAQRGVLARIGQKVGQFLSRLSGIVSPDRQTCLAELIGDVAFLGRPTNPPLVAAECDLLDTSALVNPLPDLDPESQRILSDPALLFERVTYKLKAIPRIRRADMVEYAKLVVRQLESRKVVLSTMAFRGAGVFPVGKKSGRCREVWNGHDLSEAIAKPPLPPFLASPTALTPHRDDSRHHGFHLQA